MPRHRNKWEPGDIAECIVDFYSSAPKGERFIVLGSHVYRGRPVLEVSNPRYAGVSSYFACNFINLSKNAPLLDTGHTFGASKEPKMAINSTRKPHLVIQVAGDTYNDLLASMRAMTIEGINVATADGYNDAVAMAQSLVASGHGKVMILCATAVVEPVPNTRVRQL